MLKLVLIRGAPGSGKSTYAGLLADKELVQGRPVVQLEADMYFTRPDGVYDFNPKLLGNAHEWCQMRVRNNLKFCSDDEYPGTVIVANTFTRVWEMMPYLDMAKECEATVEVYRCTGEYQNIHGVPDDKVRQMRERMQPFEGEVVL